VQHAPARREYDGFPGHPLHPLDRQIQAIELVSGRPVLAITLNHEHLSREQLRHEARQIHDRTGLPVCDPLWDGLAPVVTVIEARFRLPPRKPSPP
jgi:uncharacterized NAD-dependent epimerase/dehydratase family protein